MPQLWSALKPGGILILDQTPYRWSPVEGHTTGLPLLNYLPDRLAHWYARRSRRARPSDEWRDLLRKGIRGGSPPTILRELGSAGGAPRLLAPQRYGSRVELWYEMSVSKRPSRAKAVARGAASALAKLGYEVVPTLSLAIAKEAP